MLNESLITPEGERKETPGPPRANRTLAMEKAERSEQNLEARRHMDRGFLPFLKFYIEPAS